MCGGKRRGRAALRRKLYKVGEIYQAAVGQDEVYEQTLPPGPFKDPTGMGARGPRQAAKLAGPGRARQSRKAPEATFQIQVARYLAKALPEGFFFTTFPSGGGGRIRGARLKQQGLKAGMPDMVVFAEQDWTNCQAIERPTILWLELKAKSGSLSQAQKDVHKELLKLGHQVVTVKTLEQVQDALADFCFPEKLRARVTV